MFSTLGLFSSVRCPELSSSNPSGACKRNPCLFSHTVPAPSRLGGRVTATSSSSSSSTSKRPLSEGQSATQSTASAPHTQTSNETRKRPKLEQSGNAPGTSASGVARSAFELFSREPTVDGASDSTLDDVKPGLVARNGTPSADASAQLTYTAPASTSALPPAATALVPVPSTTRTMPLKGPGSLRKPGFQIGRNGQVVRTGPKANFGTPAGSAAPTTSASKGKGRVMDRPSPAITVGSNSSSSSSSAVPNGPTGRPRLPIDTKNTYFPIATRNAMIKAMHQEFTTLYEGLTPRGKALSMASAHSLAQELTLYGKNNKFSYRTACIQAIARLKKRPPAVTFNEAGTLEDYEKWLKDMADEERSRLTVERSVRLTLDRESAEAHGYILEVPEGTGGSIPTEEGGSKKCERCGIEYVVHGNLSEMEMQACTHHWGRMETTAADRTRRWACCQTPAGSPGCSTGPHVFSEKAAADLHSRVGFMATSALPRLSSFEAPLPIAALDCEMVYTTAGMALARLTIVNSEGVVVFDEYIRPNGVAVDLVTRWSGITEDDVERRAKLDIHQLRNRVLGRYISNDTIVIGHGLENDLKALRLIHPADRCIDTAQLFPHPRGLPYRHALRNLSRDILQAFIQDGGTAGHSSAVDACTALDLVKHKAQKVEDGTARPNR